MPYSDQDQNNAYHKKYYQQNREKMIADQKVRNDTMTDEEKAKRKEYMRQYHKAYYEANKEKIAEQAKEKYQKNKDAHKQKSKRWRENNPERAKEIYAAYADANREKISQRSKDWYAQNKERAAKSARIAKLKKYGITEKDYQEILASQGFKCAICGADHQETKDAALRVDHCHETGTVRGLLCNKCNTGLGLLGDTADAIMKAAAYLTK